MLNAGKQIWCSCKGIPTSWLLRCHGIVRLIRQALTMCSTIPTKRKVVVVFHFNDFDVFQGRSWRAMEFDLEMGRGRPVQGLPVAVCLGEFRIRV